MADVAPRLTEEVEALRNGYAALNRGDVEGFTAAFAPDFVCIEPASFPMGGTYRGLPDATAHFASARDAWAEGVCEPVRFIVAGDKVVVLVHVHVRLKHETEWREGRLADVYTFRNGKAVEMRIFADQQDAIAWAGAAAPEVS